MNAVPRTAILLLACAACAPAATGEIVRERRVVSQVAAPWPGSLRAWVAAVAPFEDGGECRVYADGRDRIVVLLFKGPAPEERSVALTVDAQGKVLGYSDVRGNLYRGTRPRTSVTVDLEGNTSTAENEHGGARGTPGMTMGSAAEAMDLENLGTPRRMIEMVKRRCMGGGN